MQDEYGTAFVCGRWLTLDAAHRHGPLHESKDGPPLIEEPYLQASFVEPMTAEQEAAVVETLRDGAGSDFRVERATLVVVVKSSLGEAAAREALEAWGVPDVVEVKKASGTLRVTLHWGAATPGSVLAALRGAKLREMEGPGWK